MSHIVIDAREYTTTTGRYMFRLLQYLDKIQSDHDYTVLLKPEDVGIYNYTNPRIKKVPCPHQEFTFEEQWGLWRQLRELKPDLVHFGMTQQPILYSGNTITTMHDLTTIRFKNPVKNPLAFTIKQEVYKEVIRIAAKKSTAIITPSEYVKQDVMKYTGIKPEKITVTHEAADVITDPAQPVAELMDKQFIMYVGRPLPHKNLGRLIDAFGQLRTSHPELRLVMVGKKDEHYERHEAEAMSKKISDVIFTGFATEGQLRWMYENCQAYVFPSLSEGFGLPALEAMVHGAPVISSNATCLPEIYGDAAHYFDPLNIADMAVKISEVLDHTELRQELIEKGRAQAAKYSWQRMAEQTYQLYNRALIKNNFHDKLDALSQ